MQVIKDALKTKDPVVTTKLSIFGSNVILTTFDTQIGVSSKLDKERAALLRKAVLSKLCRPRKEGYGIIVRTNAKNVEDKAVFARCISGSTEIQSDNKKGTASGTLFMRISWDERLSAFNEDN